MRKNLQEADKLRARRPSESKRHTSKKPYKFEGKGVHELADVRHLTTLYNIPIYPAPAHLDLSVEGYSAELIVFFDVLDMLLQTNEVIYLDFSTTITARLPMFLCIVATQEKYGAKILPILSKESPLVNRMIEATGSFKSADIRRKAMFDESVPRIPIISGSNAEYVYLADDLVDAIAAKYYGGEMPPNIEAKISNAIIETLENVGRHAYPNESNQSSKSWWLICSVGQTKNDPEDYLFLAIYDRGRGIPLSFEDSAVFQQRVQKHYPEEYRALVQGHDVNEGKKDSLTGLVRTLKSMVNPLRETIGDSGMIYASMMHDMTRIDDDSHGQGSVSIKDVITNDPESKLIIFSNKGCYQFNRGSDKEHTILEQENEMPGTLLQWSIKLDELD